MFKSLDCYPRTSSLRVSGTGDALFGPTSVGTPGPDCGPTSNHQDAEARGKYSTEYWVGSLGYGNQSLDSGRKLATGGI